MNTDPCWFHQLQQRTFSQSIVNSKCLMLGQTCKRIQGRRIKIFFTAANIRKKRVRQCKQKEIFWKLKWNLGQITVKWNPNMGGKIYGRQEFFWLHSNWGSSWEIRLPHPLSTYWFNKSRRGVLGLGGQLAGLLIDKCWPWTSPLPWGQHLA